MFSFASVTLNFSQSLLPALQKLLHGTFAMVQCRSTGNFEVKLQLLYCLTTGASTGSFIIHATLRQQLNVFAFGIVA